MQSAMFNMRRMRTGYSAARTRDLSEAGVLRRVDALASSLEKANGCVSGTHPVVGRNEQTFFKPTAHAGRSFPETRDAHVSIIRECAVHVPQRAL